MFLPMSWTSPFTVAITIVPLVPARLVGPPSPCRLLLLDERDEVGDRLLHHPRALDHLRQEHLAAPNRSPTTFMPSISGPSMTSIGRPPGAAICARSSSVSASTCSSMPLTRAWVIRSSTGSARHSSSADLCCRAGRVEPLGDLEQPLGGVGAPVEHDVLDPLAQLGVDLVVDDERAGVDDAHVDARADRVVEEHRVDRLAHRVVAAEREGHVGDAAGDQRAGQVLLDPAGRLDEVDAVARVLLDAGRHGEDVGVEDDVLGREADLLGEDLVGRAADLRPTLQAVGLALLVEGHDDGGRAVLAAQPGLLDERLLALLHGDGVDDRLALHALEAGLDDLPLRGVDHHGDPGDVGLAGDQLEEAVHRGDAVDHALVHVDVDDLGAGLDLLAGHGQRGVVVAVLDQLAEPGRAGDVGALADVDEQAVLGDGERLEPGQAQRRRDSGHRAGRHALGRRGDGGDVLRRGAAAAADEVDQPARGELAEHARPSCRASRRTRRTRWAARRSGSRRRSSRRPGRARRRRAASPRRRGRS